MRILKYSIIALILALPAQPGIYAQIALEKPPARLPGVDLRLIDATADPCVDFTKYACGNFAKIHPIPADESSYGTFDVVGDYVSYSVHAMLEKASKGGTERDDNEQKIGDYYAACLDVRTINARGLRSLKTELDRIRTLQRKQDLASLLAHYRLLEVSAFFESRVSQDLKDARKQILVFDQGGLGLPESGYYLREGEKDKRILRLYETHIAKTLALSGESESESKIDARNVLLIESALAGASLDVTARRDPMNVYHPMSIRQLQTLAPEFRWKAFIDQDGIPNVSEVNVAIPSFFKQFNDILARTSLRSIKAYLKWQMLSSLPGVNLPKPLDDEIFNFDSRLLRGQPEQSPRWRRCVRNTINNLGDAVGQVYVAQEFPASSKAATLQMVHDIEAAMTDDIDQLDWMSPQTKLRAKEKLNLLANKIGYPDKWLDYSTVEIRRDDALGNSLRATRFEQRRELAKVGQPVDRGEFIMPPTVVGAYYTPATNDINFPAGILQPPFYDPNSPDAANFGHIGSIIGHELTHGFDDQGRKFDGNGNFADWWTTEDANQFQQRSSCEVKEYSAFTVDGDAHVNGELTLGENTADNGGLRLAYMAMLANERRKHVDLSRETDGYTPIQAFFLAFGQDWCGTARPEYERILVQTDPHTPDRFRGNGALQNMPEFGKAFGCRQGQPMMPVNVCRVW